MRHVERELASYLRLEKKPFEIGGKLDRSWKLSNRSVYFQPLQYGSHQGIII